MARKKRVVKRARKRAARVSVKSFVKVKNKISLVINNLLMFVALSLVSLVLYRYIVGNDILTNLFFVMSLAFGFIAAAFLIVLVILSIMKAISKK